jgi:hypothetical protein
MALTLPAWIAFITAEKIKEMQCLHDQGYFFTAVSLREELGLLPPIMRMG